MNFPNFQALKRWFFIFPLFFPRFGGIRIRSSPVPWFRFARACFLNSETFGVGARKRRCASSFARNLTSVLLWESGRKLGENGWIVYATYVMAGTEFDKLKTLFFAVLPLEKTFNVSRSICQNKGNISKQNKGHQRILGIVISDL